MSNLSFQHLFSTLIIFFLQGRNKMRNFQIIKRFIRCIKSNYKRKKLVQYKKDRNHRENIN
ncbi:hypothetical protein KFK09_014845 [Dendrobium nobile]|uniref:Uncharacterized protein n=1 Tax=Dendrobium nobile TaxID=94219 RepID=A0A8T3B4A0_DENNO|nr:hypothetical protein KFK09_014845 [Dendrobium nobile]